MQFAASSAMVAAPATGNNTPDERVNVTAVVEYQNALVDGRSVLLQYLATYFDRSNDQD